MADIKEKLKDEEVKDVNGGLAIHFVSAEEGDADDGAVWFGTPTENGQAGKLAGIGGGDGAVSPDGVDNKNGGSSSNSYL